MSQLSRSRDVVTDVTVTDPETAPLIIDIVSRPAPAHAAIGLIHIDMHASLLLTTDP